ncbi:expressed unknown protein [Seminavis robusta]|uniref:BTB domain-containing protein n=1 Tax=Seminavis robusta TaxID=568900 RepID=A0A9N8HY09_9STRA|nr:expressed unknown protein [Seminavis robusta]|eukprot:Sro2360_g324731.1  (510) ;mRNA; f:2374-3903
MMPKVAPSTTMPKVASSTMLTKAENIEVTRSQAFALLADPDYHDISLVGTDGVLVPANQIALMVRSDYFKTMFKKDGFKESTSNPVVSIGFCSKVLKTIVDYIHTDNASALVDYSESAVGAFTADHMMEIQTLVSLTEAAMFVGLPGLCQKAQNCLFTAMNVMPSVAFAVLAASKQEGPVISKELTNQAWRSLFRANGCLNEVTLQHTSSTVLVAILQDAKANIDTTKLFNLIHSWSKCKPSVPDETKEDRQNSAKAMIQDHVELDLMDPDDLSTLVETSGLVTKDQLYDVFKNQAKKAKKAKQECSISFPQSHSSVGQVEWKRTKSETFTAVNDWSSDPFDRDLEWKRTKSKTCTAVKDWSSDTLDRDPIEVGGKYCWTVTIDPTARFGIPGVWLGVAKSTHRLSPNNFCGQQKHCWGIYGRNGNIHCGGKTMKGPVVKFGAGSSVTMTLDLSGLSTSNGTLSISVNSQPAVVVFSNLQAQLVESDDGFVPVVSCMKTSATIVNFQRL